MSPDADILPCKNKEPVFSSSNLVKVISLSFTAYCN
jgi:hypothetical protein